jgi:soluble lytic murein transglycosylase-like protein
MEIRKAAIIAAAVVIFFLIIFYSRKKEPDRAAVAKKIKAEPWYKTIIQESKNYNLPPQRVAAIVAVESGGNTAAKGAAGENGLMQIMPGAHKAVQDHWSRLVTFSWIHSDGELFKPEYNILVGTAYLAMLKGQFKNDLDKATEAYNDGGGYGTDYLDKVKAYEPYFL